MRYLGLMAVLLFSGCGASEKMDVMFECASPSGGKIATFYRITTGDRPGDQEMKLNIRATSTEFDDGMHSFSFRHGYDAIIRWNSDMEISVVYPADSELTYQESIVFGTSQSFRPTDQIKISYEEKQSTHGYFMVEKRCYNKP